MYIFRHIHIGVVVFFLKVINMPPTPPFFFFLSLIQSVEVQPQAAQVMRLEKP